MACPGKWRTKLISPAIFGSGGFILTRFQMAMGQKPAYPPVNIPIPTKIGSKMGGEFTCRRKWDPKTVLAHFPHFRQIDFDSTKIPPVFSKSVSCCCVSWSTPSCGLRGEIALLASKLAARSRECGLGPPVAKGTCFLFL